jgi:DNA-3-methyladenine glycosylase II
MAATEAITSVELPVRGGFELAASMGFLEGFTPAGRGDAAEETGVLRLAFPAAPRWETARVVVRQRGRDVVAEVPAGDDAELVAGHAARILSLDVDGAAFGEVAAGDPVIGGLHRRYPGLRPVLFHSPYEAACWTIIGHRIRITQAAALKQRIAAELGERVPVAGVELTAFPAPERLLSAARVPGLPEVKVERLRAIAAAALDGALDAAHLRGLPADAALAELRRLPGIGPFSAELTLIRGAGHPDVFPTAERRLHEEMAGAYDLTDPSLAELSAIAERWRPYRSWASFLLRVRREDDTGEIAGKRR